MILVFLVLVVVVVAVAVGGVYFRRNSIVKAAVEQGGTYALGVDTTLGSADLDLGGGSLTLNRLCVANPDGFDTPTFLELNRGFLAVEAGSFLEDQVEVPELTFDGVRLTLDKHKGKANYEQILDNVERFEGSETASEAEETDEAIRLVVRRIVIRDIEVSASLLPIAGDLTRARFAVDEIVLADIGTDHPQGLSYADLTVILTKAGLSASLEAGGGILPDELLGGLTTALGDVANLENVAVDFKKVLDEEAGKILEDVSEETVKEAAEKVGGALKGLRKGLGGDK